MLGGGSPAAHMVLVQVRSELFWPTLRIGLGALNVVAVQAATLGGTLSEDDIVAEIHEILRRRSSDQVPDGILASLNQPDSLSGSGLSRLRQVS
eukprot:731439-Rhodomonas_salina.1